MRLASFLRVCLCVLAVAASQIAARAAAEPVPVPPVPDPATLGLWRFQEGRGDRVACEGKAPAATMHGAVWVPGREGFAAATHAGYVEIPDAPTLRPEKAITVDVWVKLAKAGGDLICKNGGYLMRLENTLNGVFYSNDKSFSIQGSRPLPTGRWTHLAMTYDSATRTAAIYVDGELDAKKKFDAPAGLLSQRTANLRVGANDWSATGSEVDGKIAMLRISNVARSFEPPASAANKAIPKGNLVANGDFELGLLNWRLQGEGDANLTWKTDATNAASGRLCLKYVGEKQGILSRPIPVQPGAQYTFSARMRSDVKQWPRVEVVGVGAGESFVAVPPFPLYPSVEPAWSQVTKSFVLPKDFASPSVCIYFNAPSEGAFWVDDVRLVAGDKADVLTFKDKIAVGPKPSAVPVGNLYLAGSKTPAPLNVVNTDTVAHKVAVQATVVDWEGKPLPPVAVGTFDVPAGGVKEVPFSIDTTRRGNFWLGFQLTSEGQTWKENAEFKYAVVVPMKGVGPAEDSIFAMNTHMERESTPHLARSMEVLSQCGVKWIRAWWGWGMCEKTQGTFDFTEFDRQFNAVTSGTGMRIMPILLRYYSDHEQKWAGPVTKGAIQEYPDPKMLPEWKVFCGKVADHYKGRITAYEIWNEPTMGGAPHGNLTPQQYADLLKNSTPAIRQYDPKAKIIGFAGVPLDFLKDTLKLGVAPLMDVISEHSYSELAQPEANMTKQTAAVRSVLTAAGCGNMPIWHTEQGLRSDGDGYSVSPLSEADTAALYTRDVVVASSLGIQKFFWFSAQTSPGYTMAVFYENYIPRPRLTALNACASFLEGLKYRKSFQPVKNAYVHLYDGANPTCVVWSLNAPVRLSLPVRPGALALQVFDLMGNPVPVTTEKDGIAIEMPAERPMYLRCGGGEYAALEKALAGAKMTALDPVLVKARPTAGGLEVTVISRSPAVLDGVVEMVASTDVPPAGWPASKHFHSLKPEESQTFTLALPAGAGEGRVRVRVGDRDIQEVTASAGK